eukprot:scaffold65810_cov37-Attheya_sp.AAC.2
MPRGVHYPACRNTGAALEVVAVMNCGQESIHILQRVSVHVSGQHGPGLHTTSQTASPSWGLCIDSIELSEGLGNSASQQTVSSSADSPSDRSVRNIVSARHHSKSLHFHRKRRLTQKDQCLAQNLGTQVEPRPKQSQWTPCAPFLSGKCVAQQKVSVDIA